MRATKVENGLPAADQPGLDMGPLRDDVGFQIHITRRAIWAALRPSRRKAKNRPPSGYISTLLLIGTNPGVSPSEIAHALTIDMPNMALIVRMLEEQQLIERRTNPADRRRLSLSLTALGRERYVEVTQANAAHSRKLRSRLSDEELRQLIELLGKVRSSVLGPAEEGEF